MEQKTITDVFLGFDFPPICIFSGSLQRIRGQPATVRLWVLTVPHVASYRCIMVLHCFGVSCRILV